jgi:hypothetical protein
MTMDDPTQHPLVKKTLEVFKGSEIVDVSYPAKASITSKNVMKIELTVEQADAVSEVLGDWLAKGVGDREPSSVQCIHESWRIIESQLEDWIGGSRETGGEIRM